jgi:hypothetical protein
MHGFEFGLVLHNKFHKRSSAGKSSTEPNIRLDAKTFSAHLANREEFIDV